MNVIIDAEIAAVRDTVGVIDSAIALINTIAAKIDAAVQAALAGGATAAELAPLTDLQAELLAKKVALSDAVVANS
jgi:hypothetical protein